MKHIFRWMAALALLACGAAHGADDFLPPEQAFRLDATLRADRTVALAWTIAPGYHLYRDRLVFDAPQVGVPALPDGVRKFDSNFNKEMETYANRLEADLPLAVLAGSVSTIAMLKEGEGLAFLAASGTSYFAIDGAGGTHHHKVTGETA